MHELLGHRGRAGLLAVMLGLGCDPRPDEPAPPPAAATPRELPPTAAGPETAPAPAAPRAPLADPSPSPSPDGLVATRLPITATSATAEVYEVDLRRHRLVGVDARRDDRIVATVDVLREEAGALLAVNGTFFDEHERPLGLLVSEGRERSPLRDADWGVLSVDVDGTATLVHTRDFSRAPSIDFAVQCGPRVVIDGRPPSLRPQTARRTGLCILDPHTVAVWVTTRAVEANLLAAWLATPRARGGLGCRDALLLDGGPSTQLDWRDADEHPTIEGGWPVPNAVAVVAREGSAPDEGGRPGREIR